MSLCINDCHPEADLIDEKVSKRHLNRSVRHLTQGLLQEENRNAGRAALSDADLALDMAGFVCERTHSSVRPPSPSLHELALALLQRDRGAANAPQQ